jgi:serine/threonine-protein kinase
MLPVLDFSNISPTLKVQIFQFTHHGIALAQITNTGGSASSLLVPYQNPAYGVSLHYPSDWQKEEGNRTIAGNLSAWSVAFYSPPPSKSAFLKVIQLNSTQPNGTASIPKLLTEAISRDIHITKDLQIINATSNYTLAGRPAYMLITTGELIKNIRYQTLEIGTISGNSKYAIVYEALGPVYSKYLPSAQKMIGSFRLG